VVDGGWLWFKIFFQIWGLGFKNFVIEGKFSDSDAVVAFFGVNTVGSSGVIECSFCLAGLRSTGGFEESL